MLHEFLALVLYLANGTPEAHIFEAPPGAHCSVEIATSLATLIMHNQPPGTYKPGLNYQCMEAEDPPDEPAADGDAPAEPEKHVPSKNEA